MNTLIFWLIALGAFGLVFCVAEWVWDLFSPLEDTQ